MVCWDSIFNLLTRLLVHSMRVVHRGMTPLIDTISLALDIKPENLLLTREGVAKIGDFSVSLFLESDDDEKLKRTVGSPAFLAPELCAGMF